MMTALRTLLQLARADLRERRRRYSFLILVGATVFLCYLFVPPPDAPYLTLALGYARGVYNSAFVGAMFGLVITTLVTMFAFYPIKNAVTRDRETQVGQLIASTPVPKPVYVLGKWLSNVALLATLLVVMTWMAVAMQLVRAEDLHIDLVALAVPLWLIAFPALTLVAALAVLFECTPVLRGGAGNVLYFFLILGVLMGSIDFDADFLTPTNDPFALGYVISDMQQTLLAIDPNYSGDLEIGAEKIDRDPLLFEWNGLRWTTRMVLGRLLWVGVAAALALIAALPFDRFDPARLRQRRQRSLVTPPAETATTPAVPKRAAPPTSAGSGAASLTPLVPLRYHPRLSGVLLAELRLMLKANRW